jgi:hypothetical protein
MLRLDGFLGMHSFIRHDGWTDLLEAVQAEHRGRPSAALDRDILSGAATAAFEDFATRTYDGRGNVIDAYLAGPGRREPGEARAWLKALRKSAPSLYEVADVQPGRTLTLRDLMRGHPPVIMPDHTPHFPAGWMFTRLIEVRGRTGTSDTMLGVTKPVDKDDMVATLQTALGRSTPMPWNDINDADLRRTAAAVTRMWVRQAMD